MTNEEISNLKQGDVVRHEPSGTTYVVMNTHGGVATVLRSISLHTGPDWSHVYTPTPVKPFLSLVEKITQLERLGWSYSDEHDEWCSPDKSFWAKTLQTAWASRDNHPA